MRKSILLMMVGLIPAQGCGDYTIHERYDPEVQTVKVTAYADVFEATEERLDILFLVDESCSMAEEQWLLHENIGPMLSTLDSPDFTGISWQAGVASMDPSEPTYAWIDEAEGSWVAAQWIDYLDSSCQDMGCEAGFDAAIMSNWNDTEHRADADLLVVFISDESDSSTNDVDSYLKKAGQFRHLPFTTMHSAIVYKEQSAPCTGQAPSNVVIGYGYMDVSSVVVDFCDYNAWPDTMLDAAEHAHNINKHFYLTHKPDDIFGITVQIEYEPLEDDAWDYVDQTNSVSLKQSARPGEHVTVVYTTTDEVVDEQ